jgi:hypothetical protein
VSTHLAQQAQDLEAPAVDFEGGRTGEAVQTAPEGRDEVEKDLRHGGLFGGVMLGFEVQLEAAQCGVRIGCRK